MYCPLTIFMPWACLCGKEKAFNLRPERSALLSPLVLEVELPRLAKLPKRCVHRELCVLSHLHNETSALLA